MNGVLCPPAVLLTKGVYEKTGVTEFLYTISNVLRTIMTKAENVKFTLIVLLVVVKVFFLCQQVHAEEKTIVKRVYNGNTIKMRDGTKVKYIGIDAPDKKGLPFYRMCKEANKKLVNKKEIVIKTDLLEKDENGKVLAYVYVGDLFVNAELIRLGCALACNMPPNERYKDKFFSLQKAARKEKRGFWVFEDISAEPYYIGSKNKKEFHRPGCFHANHLDFDDRIILRTKEEALRRGFAQDWRCCPLFEEPEEDIKDNTSQKREELR